MRVGFLVDLGHLLWQNRPNKAAHKCDSAPIVIAITLCDSAKSQVHGVPQAPPSHPSIAMVCDQELPVSDATRPVGATRPGWRRKHAKLLNYAKVEAKLTQQSFSFSLRVAFRGSRVEGCFWRVEGGGWVEGRGSRVEGRGSRVEG